MHGSTRPVVFTPSNEPYLGLDQLLKFDKLIGATLELNAATAPRSHGQSLTDHQHMACLVIAQALSISLSIRELIRQGYLFGGHVLVRPFVERAVMLIYLYLFPDDIDIWNHGWNHRDAPGLAKMLERIRSKHMPEESVPASHLTTALNSLLHARPDSAKWNMISIRERPAHAVSKILDRPELCDELCGNVIPWLTVVGILMGTYFPEKG